MIHNLKHLKLAKIYSKDLAVIISNIEGELNFLNSYKHYKPVSRLCYSMKEELLALKKNLQQCKNIVDSKGLTRDG